MSPTPTQLPPWYMQAVAQAQALNAAQAMYGQSLTTSTAAQGSGGGIPQGVHITGLCGNGGPGSIYTTSTSAIYGPGSAYTRYVGIAVSESDQRLFSKWDGVLEGYWTMLVSGKRFAFLGPGDVFEQARVLVQLCRNPQPQVRIKQEEERVAAPGWIVEERMASYEREIERRRELEIERRAVWEKYDAMRQQHIAAGVFRNNLFGAPINDPSSQEQSLFDRIKSALQRR